MTLSLSTMWAQQDRFVADMHRFVDEARALGYDAIEVSHSTATAQFERLMSYEWRAHLVDPCAGAAGASTATAGATAR